MTIPRVAVSYSWTEEKSGKNAGAVEKFCQELRAAGVEVIRDKDRVKHGECLDAFMRKVAASDYLCVFLSESYPKSPNCMFELLLAWQRHQAEPGAFSKHVKIWVMPGAEGIRDIPTRLQYATLWTNEVARIKPFIAVHAPEGTASPATQQQYQRIIDFGLKADTLLAYAADVLSPRDAGEFTAWVAAEFISRRDAALEAMFGQVIAEMEDLLAANPCLANFVKPRMGNLLRQGPGGWIIDPASTKASFDLCPFLKPIVDDLRRFQGNAQDRAALGDFTAGLLMLGLDRSWVWEQRHTFMSSAVQVPAFGQIVDTGAGSRPANILHVAVQAVADGRVRLEKLFGKVDDDPFLIGEDLPLVPIGNQARDQAREAKLHFIRYILKSDQAIDPANAGLVDKKFEEVRSILRSVFYDERSPYFAKGENYLKLAELVRQELQLADLILIQPTGTDSPQAILRDHIRVFRFLSKIFDFVQGR